LIHFFYTLEIINERLICSLTLKWVKDYANLKIQDIDNTLELSKLIFSVYGLYFPDKPTLIAIYIIIMLDIVKLGTASFISSVVLYYRNAYAIELCGILSIMKLLEYIILSNNILLNC